MAVVNKKVIIAGLCRNVEATIEKTLEKLRETAVLFSDHKIIIYENNSTDGTKEKLKKAANEKLVVKCEDFTYDEFLKNVKARTWNDQPYRGEMIANARNKVLDIIAADVSLADFDYLLWIDLDFTKWENDALVNCFANEDWDAITSNCVLTNGNYRDTYATRDEKHAFGPEIFGDYWWKKISPQMGRKLEGKKLIPVLSAFGGLGIYKLSSIKNCRYSAHVTREFHEENKKLMKAFPFSFMQKRVLKKLKANKVIDGVLQGIDYFDGEIFYPNNSGTNFPIVCEHVIFHYQMRHNGFGRIFIDPALKVYM